MDWPKGLDRHVYDSLDSTNSEARRLAEAGRPDGWILAHEQTAARGRRGRVWSSQRGNFAATLLLSLNGSIEHAALRSFTASLALLHALGDLIGREDRIALKWPNDLLLNQRKLSGILLETCQSQGRTRLLVGIGVNLKHVPSDVDLEPDAVPAIALSDIGILMEPEHLLDRLAPAFDRLERKFIAEGFAPIRAEWLDHAARLGEPLRARTPNRSYEGIFVTVDESGALVLKTAEGSVTLSAADVHFGLE